MDFELEALLGSNTSNNPNNSYSERHQPTVTPQIKSEARKLKKIKEEEQVKLKEATKCQNKEFDLYKENINESILFFNELLSKVHEKDENYKYNNDIIKLLKTHILKAKDTYKTIYQFVDRMINEKSEADILSYENDTNLKKYEAKIPTYKKELWELQNQINNTIKKTESFILVSEDGLQKNKEEIQHVDDILNKQTDYESVENELKSKLFTTLDCEVNIRHEESVKQGIKEEFDCVDKHLEMVEEMLKEITSSDHEINDLEMVKLDDEIKFEHAEKEKIMSSRNYRKNLLKKTEHFEGENRSLQQKCSDAEKKLMEAENRFFQTKINLEKKIVTDANILKRQNEIIAFEAEKKITLENEIKTSSENVTALATVDDKLKIQIASLKESISDTTTSVKNIDSEYNKIVQDVDELQSGISTLSVEQEKLINIMKNDKIEHENKIAEINIEIQNIEKQAVLEQSKLLNKIGELNNDCENVEKVTKQLRVDRIKLEEEKSKLIIENSNKDNQLAKLTQDFLECVQKIKKLQQERITYSQMQRNKPFSFENTNNISQSASIATSPANIKKTLNSDDSDD